MLQTVGGWGFGMGMSWSSAWMGWAVSPGQDVDRAQRGDEASGVEHAFDHGQHVGVHGHLLPPLAVDEEVVDAKGGETLEPVLGGLDGEPLVQLVEVVEESVDEVEGDGVADDREALLGDLGHVGPDVDLYELFRHGSMLRTNAALSGQ